MKNYHPSHFCEVQHNDRLIEDHDFRGRRKLFQVFAKHQYILFWQDNYMPRTTLRCQYSFS